MPYDTVKDLPASVQKLPPKSQRQWMHVWNDAFSRCMAKDEGSTASCEASAFQQANGVVKGSEMPIGVEPLLEKADPRVDYRPASGDQSCATCRFFDPTEMECSVVEGTITPNMISNLWTAAYEGVIPVQGDPSYELYHEPSVGLAMELSKGFAELDFSKPMWIPYLPKPGNYIHPLYGEIVVTPEINQEFVDSVKNHVYQANIPIDAEHETKLSGAVGWLKDMRLNADGSADGFVEWAARGQTLLKAGQFKYFSPEWFDEWTDVATNVVHKNVIAGGAITTRPFFKESILHALVASEGGYSIIRTKEAGMKTCAGCGKTYADAMKACPSCGSTKVASEGGNKVPEIKFTEDQEKAIQERIDAAVAEAKPKEGEVFTEAQVKEREEAAAKVAAEKALAEAGKKPEETAAFTELKTRVELAEASNVSLKTANETLAKTLTEITNESRHRRFSDLVAGKGGENDGGPWIGDAAKHVAFLEALADKVGEKDQMFVDHITQQNATAAQIRESGLFSEAGVSGSTGGNGEDKLDAMAKALQASDPKLSFGDAYNRVIATPEGAKIYAEQNAAHMKGAKA